MANTIVLKRSATPGKVPTTGQLSLGEIAINTYDGLIYIKKDDGTPSVVQIGGVTSVNSKTGAVSLSTTDISEGTSQYFTQARARGAVSASGSLSYNASTGVFSYSTPTTIASLSNHTTDNLTEGTTNKYYADSLARGAISVTAGVGGYNSSTGVISIPNNTNQLTNGANFATQSYVTSAVNAISTSSISQGNSNISVVDTGTGTVTVTVDGSTALTVDSTGVTVAGNFTVSGTQTVVNSNTISLADNIITLNSDASGTPTQNAGIEVNRGSSTNVQLRWNEGSQTWTFTNDGSVYYPIAVSTTDLAEGTNQYFTAARARGALSATTASGISFNSSTGAFSLGNIPNSSLTNSSITINGTAVSLGGTRTLDTDAIGEGVTNQYFTTARARSSVSAGTGISYNSTTGAISTSAIPNASLTNSKVTVGTTDISLGGSSTTLGGLTSVTSTSFVGALTGNADTATSAGKWTTARTITLAGDLTGSVSIDGSANVTLTGTVAANSVALGTDTTGNYMVDLTAGTGITVTHTQGEGSNATVAVDTTTIATKAYVDSQILTKDNTDEITEGTTNLYFTTARARNSVSAGTGISYNSTTGVISADTTSAVDKTTAQTLTNKSLSDSTTFIIDETDGTKKLQFQVSGITTGTTRTLTAPDVSGTIITTGDTGTVTSTMIADGTIVNGDISASAAIAYSKLALTGAILNADLAGSIADTKLSTIATAGKVSNSATTATNLNTASAIVARDASGNFSAGTITASLSGNASTATALQTARAINGVSFDGSAAITVKASTTNALTIGTGLSGTSFDGSGAVTIANTGVTSNVAGSNITVSGATGAVTIATSATPTFTGITSGYTRPSANSATAYQVQNAAGTSILNVDSTNNRVGVNNTAPAVAFHVTGAGAFTGELTAYYSDKRLKENIKPIENALEKVTQLHGVTYNANSVAVGFGFTDTDEQVGLLAQDVQAVLPQVVVPAPFDLSVKDGKKVSKSGEDYITVKYEKIVALLVEAIKELNDKVESLEAQLGGGKSL